MSRDKRSGTGSRASRLTSRLIRTSDLVPFATHDLVLACDKVDRDDSPYIATYLAEDADRV